jgi:hypothetical protein
MSKLEMGPWIRGKVDIEFDQGEQTDIFEAELAASGVDDPEGVLRRHGGFCMTAALYWIKGHRKFSDRSIKSPVVPGALHNKLLTKREKLIRRHEEAALRMEHRSAQSRAASAD